jgi:hypothetical protein
MGLSDFEYTAAWSVGSLVAFGVFTIGCKQIPAFGASPSFAAHMIVHVFLVSVICHYAGLTQCAPLSALSTYHRLCPSGSGRALLPSPGRARGDRLYAPVSPAQFARHLTNCCMNDRLLQPRRAAGLDHRAASHAPGAHVHL